MTAGGWRLKLFICSAAPHEMEHNAFPFSAAQSEYSQKNSKMNTLSPINDLSLGKSEGKIVQVDFSGFN